MQIHHIALWVKDIEKMRSFYSTYFNCRSGDKYVNRHRSFESYFLEFDNGAKLEIMQMPSIPGNKNDVELQYTGFIHIAVSTGSKENVDIITERLQSDGYRVVSAPRFTGDGFYESCVLDPELNRIELTV